jgi:hypothetical protein
MSKTILKPIWTCGIQLWGTASTSNIEIPIESLKPDSGRTLVCAEYGYPKRSPNINGERRNPPLQQIKWNLKEMSRL